MAEKFTREEDDLEIEHPAGSRIFIPLREYNRIMDEKKACEKADKAEDAGSGKPE